MTEPKLRTLKYKKLIYKGKVPIIESIFVTPNCSIRPFLINPAKFFHPNELQQVGP